jgi:hypothetical protein
MCLDYSKDAYFPGNHSLNPVNWGKLMKPKRQIHQAQRELFLVKLGWQIDWTFFGERFGQTYTAANGAPGVRTRLLKSLQYLKISVRSDRRGDAAMMPSTPQRRTSRSSKSYFGAFAYASLFRSGTQSSVHSPLCSPRQQGFSGPTNIGPTNG